MNAHLTLTVLVQEECSMHTSWQRSYCERERKAMQAVARSGKPAGYSWRLWNDPRGPKGAPKIETGPIRDWRYPCAAYKNATKWAGVDAEHLESCMLDWRAGTHPWCRREPAPEPAAIESEEAAMIYTVKYCAGTYSGFRTVNAEDADAALAKVRGMIRREMAATPMYADSYRVILEERAP